MLQAGHGYPSLRSLENYGEIQRATSDNLEDFDYSSLQFLAPNLDLSDPLVCQGIANQLTAEVRFDMTSVHDASLRDAWSKVIQGVMDILPNVESLMMHFTEVGLTLELKSGLI